MTTADLLARRLATLLAAALLLVAPGLQAQEVVYYHTDALGSVVAVTDQNRNVLEKSEYEPYGYVSNHPPQDGPGYTGHVLDALTGMNYMQDRYYDPIIGRFLSRDPVTANPNIGMNFNGYWYANNNPYRFTDPDGRQAADLRVTAQQAELAGKDIQEVRTAEMRPIGEAIAAGVKTYIGMFVSQFTNGPSGVAGGPMGVFTKAESGASALTRAKEIQGALKPATQGRVTTAVTETQEGVRVVTSSEGALRPAQRAALQAGEVAGKGTRGTHAEVNGVNAAKGMGLNPTSVSPSRPACAGCQGAMKREGVGIIDR